MGRSRGAAGGLVVCWRFGSGVAMVSDGYGVPKIQDPRSKIQRRSKQQAPNRRSAASAWDLDPGSSLDLGSWILDLLTGAARETKLMGHLRPELKWEPPFERRSNARLWQSQNQFHQCHRRCNARRGSWLSIR